jgi:peptide/nickel transport system permease protein
MANFLIRRLVQAIPLLVVVWLSTFLIVEIAPGDVAQMYIDPDHGTDPAYIAQVRLSLGLEQPVYVNVIDLFEKGHAVAKTSHQISYAGLA